MPHNLDIDLLKTFTAIARHGNFTRAAIEVNKTQSAVSMQMKRLEEIIGRSLFTKHGRLNRLSDDGEKLLEYAHRIIRLNDEAVSSFHQPELAGSITMGTPDDYADQMLPEILARFARSHPHIQVSVECNSSFDLADAIEAGRLDLAIVTTGRKIYADTIVRREALVWMTSIRHYPHEQKVIPVALTNHGCTWRQKAIDSLEQGNHNYRIAYSSDNSNAIAAAVLSGLAIAAMPRLVIRPGMRVLTEADGFPTIGEFNIGLLRAQNTSNSAIDALAHHIADSYCQINQPLLAAE